MLAPLLEACPQAKIYLEQPAVTSWQWLASLLRADAMDKVVGGRYEESCSA